MSFDGGQTELAEVETCDVQCSATDEQAVSLSDVGVTAAVKTTQRDAVQLDVTYVNCVRR